MRLRRIWFKKTGDIRFISHLDLMRTMTRTITRARIPLWYTEGFNPHPYMTFALPLSLGMESEKESMDLKLEDSMTDEEVLAALRENAPPSLEFYAVTEPVLDPKFITYAVFDVRFFTDRGAALTDCMEKLFSQEHIMVQKLGKKGRRKVLRDIDLKEHIKDWSVGVGADCVTLHLVLPAGSVTNVNPELAVKKLLEAFGEDVFYIIRRVTLLDKDMNEFA